MKSGPREEGRRDFIKLLSESAWHSSRDHKHKIGPDASVLLRRLQSGGVESPFPALPSSPRQLLGLPGAGGDSAVIQKALGFGSEFVSCYIETELPEKLISNHHKIKFCKGAMVTPFQAGALHGAYSSWKFAALSRNGCFPTFSGDEVP